MKSIIVTTLIFALLALAVGYNVFEITSSSYAYMLCSCVLIIAFVAAFRVLGNPFEKKDKDDENIQK